MEMRKFIIEMHPDGTSTCCEYQDPKDAIRAANDRQALAHCDEQVNTIEGFKKGLACQPISCIRVQHTCEMV